MHSPRWPARVPEACSRGDSRKLRHAGSPGFVQAKGATGWSFVWAAAKVRLNHWRHFRAEVVVAFNYPLAAVRSTSLLFFPAFFLLLALFAEVRHVVAALLPLDPASQERRLHVARRFVSQRSGGHGVWFKALHELSLSFRLCKLTRGGRYVGLVLCRQSLKSATPRV